MRLFDPADASHRSFDSLRHAFKWQLPTRYNIADSVCRRHPPDTIALYCETASGTGVSYTFGQLDRWSNQLANALQASGVMRGDRVAVVLPQRLETGLAHLAIYKLGAIALPLSVLFGSDALRFRLNDSGARAVITDAKHYPLLESLLPDTPALSAERLWCCDSQRGEHALWPWLERASDQFATQITNADDPALLIYTSGTTGNPKGALDAHRCLLGNLSGFELSQNFFPLTGSEVFWTPADWAWTGGLLDALLPSWHYGRPVLAFHSDTAFDPEHACYLLAKYRITNAFIPPTAMKMLMQVNAIQERHTIHLRAVMSAGETVGEALIDWAKRALGVAVNEMWGQTEFNYLVGNCAAIMPIKPGAMGKPYPGHEVQVLTPDGHIAASNETGELVARRGDPVMFLGYWNQPQATAEKFDGDWFHTGDMGYRDDDGYLWFVGRNDDVISSAGYRIGPGEIENCLLKHPAVVQAAVIGVPDPDGLRGELIKACLVLAPEHRPITADAEHALVKNIQAAVKTQLAAYEYPRLVEFYDALPLTTTGKVRRTELRARH